MRYKLANISSSPDAIVQKLNEVHHQKTTALEEQVNSDSPEKGMLYSNAVGLYIMLSLFLKLL